MNKKDQDAIAKLYLESVDGGNNDPNTVLGKYSSKEVGEILPWVGISRKNKGNFDTIYSVDNMDDPVLNKYPQFAFFTTNHFFVDGYGNEFGPVKSSDFENEELYNKFLNIVNQSVGGVRRPAPKSQPYL